MHCKGVSIFLGWLGSGFLGSLRLDCAKPLQDQLLRTICWNFMAGRDGCINEGRHVSGALELFAQVGEEADRL